MNQKKHKKDTDADVARMVKNWDKVKCHDCGKTISMFEAILIDGRYFVHKERSKCQR